MRCHACNSALSDFESTRKSATTGDYLDLCNRCFAYVKDDIAAVERYDLYHAEDEPDTGDGHEIDLEWAAEWETDDDKAR